MNSARMSIARIAADQSDFDFTSIRKRQRPVILTGAVSRWPATRKWSLDYIGETFGDSEFMAEIDLPDDVPVSHDLKEFQRKVRLRDFITSIRDPNLSRPSYITNKSIDKFPGLSDDVMFEDLLGIPVKNELIRLWIGTAHTKSSLHFDYYDNVLCQIAGAKRVFLVDPKHTSSVYQYSSNIDKSQVDVETPDFERFPKFRRAVVMEDVLDEGEILVILMLWWHSLRSLSPSISLSCFYGRRAGERELIPMMLAGGVRLISTFTKDFLWSGLLNRPYRKRLYAAEPFGVWFYCQLRDSFARRMKRLRRL